MGINVFPQSSGMDLSIYKKDNVYTTSALALTQSALTTLVSVTGKKGFLNYFCCHTALATGKNLRIKITVDGVVVYYAGMAATSTNTHMHFIGLKDYITITASQFLLPRGGGSTNIQVQVFATGSFINLTATDGTDLSQSDACGGMIISSPIFFNTSLLIEAYTDYSSVTINPSCGYKTLS